MPLTQTGQLRNNLTGSSPDGQAAEYFGTVTVNGSTPVSLGATNYAAGDVVLFALLTVGGTVGQLPHIVTTALGAATVAATASDTSVYNYWGFTPIAQSV